MSALKIGDKVRITGPGIVDHIDAEVSSFYGVHPGFNVLSTTVYADILKRDGFTVTKVELTAAQRIQALKPGSIIRLTDGLWGRNALRYVDNEGIVRNMQGLRSGTLKGGEYGRTVLAEIIHEVTE